MVSRKQANFKASTKECILSFLTITKSMHKMTDQEIKILTLFLFYHNKEKKNFARDKDLWKHIFDYDTKLKIREELEIGNAVFQNILTSLRKKKVIKNNQIIPYFILNIKEEDEAFELIFRYKLNG